MNLPLDRNSFYGNLSASLMHTELQSWLKLHQNEREASAGMSDSTHLDEKGATDPACELLPKEQTEEQDSYGDCIIAMKSPSSGISNLVEVCLQIYYYYYYYWVF